LLHCLLNFSIKNRDKATHRRCDSLTLSLQSLYRLTLPPCLCCFAVARPRFSGRSLVLSHDCLGRPGLPEAWQELRAIKIPGLQIFCCIVSERKNKFVAWFYYNSGLTDGHNAKTSLVTDAHRHHGQPLLLSLRHASRYGVLSPSVLST